MTICVSVKVRDGLVLSTDSMSQIQTADANTGEVRVIKAYSNARKLFQIVALPIGAMSWGLGNIGNRSIHSFMIEFNRMAVNGGTSDVCQSLYTFIKGAYDTAFAAVEPQQRPVLGFFVAGYSPGAVFAEEWEFELPTDDGPKIVKPQEQFGAAWRGIWIPFTRIYYGYDPRFTGRLLAAGVTQDVIDQALGDLQTNVVFDGMPVQDAANFARYIVETTVGIATFDAGTASCGGPLQVATILPEAGFEWVLKPKIGV
jgi:hypothetical protein